MDIDMKQQVIMNRIPKTAPGCGPDGTITSMYLVDSVLDEIFFNPQGGRPEDGTRAIGRGGLERIIAEVFGLENGSKEGIFIGMFQQHG
jgi:hypothetical protein